MQNLKYFPIIRNVQNPKILFTSSFKLDNDLQVFYVASYFLALLYLLFSSDNSAIQIYTVL